MKIKKYSAWLLILILFLSIPSASASATTCSDIGLTRTLRQGNTGSDVQILQKVLNINNLTLVATTGAGSPGNETTYFGTATKNAVIKFQSLNNLRTDGIAGTNTYNAMNSMCDQYSKGGGTIIQAATTASTFTFNINLSQGMRHPDVLELQKVLNLSSDTQVSRTGAGSPGNETTYFGSSTKKAVIKFQEKYSISPTSGYVGPLTRTKLNEILANQGGGSLGSVQGITVQASADNSTYTISGLTDSKGRLKDEYKGPIGGGGGGSSGGNSNGKGNSSGGSGGGSTTTGTTTSGGSGSTTTTGDSTTGGTTTGGTTDGTTTSSGSGSTTGGSTTTSGTTTGGTTDSTTTGGTTSDSTTGGTTTGNETPVNNNPVANDDTVTNLLDQPATGNVLSNDTDADSDTLTVTSVSIAGNSFNTNTNIIQNGIGTFRISTTGSYTFTPNANYYSAVPVVTYFISDGRGGTASANLTITLTPRPNTAPVAVNDTASLPMNGSKNGNVLTNDTDVDNDDLTVTSFTVNSSQTTAGTVKAITGIGSVVINSNGAYSFTPATDYVGTVPEITYAITDGRSGTATAILALTVTAVTPPPDNSSGPGAFTFTLSSSMRTSAGVFNGSGTLVRTLWGNVTYTAGTHTEYWDGKDDFGNVLTTTGTGYTIKVLSNNVTYTWEGEVGNSSTLPYGENVIGSIRSTQDMVIVGGTAYYGNGFVEGQPSSAKIILSDIGKRYQVSSQGTRSLDLELNFVDSDGTNVYWAGIDPWGGSNTKSMIYATKVSDDSDYTFQNGTRTTLNYGRVYNSAIDVVSGISSRPTGLAVQSNGSYLYIARGGLNEIRVFNKSTGALVQTISSITNPRGLTADSLGNLWVISGTNTVSKHTVRPDGTITSATLTLSGLVAPHDMSISPNGSTIAVLDAGTSQQIKAFSTSTGAISWTLGQSGGYANDATVANDKFMFLDVNELFTSGFVAYQPDGSIWVGDSGNNRILHFNSSRSWIETISHIPMNYAVNADRNNPTRVFSGFLEFQIDYSKPLAGNNGSWKLVKNWLGGVDSTKYVATNNNHVFRNVMTLSNGRTYGTLLTKDTYKQEVFELPATGNLRSTGNIFGQWEFINILDDGSILTFNSTQTVGTTPTWYKRSLTGFTNNNPVWGNKVAIGTAKINSTLDAAYKAGAQALLTNSNKLIVFDPGSRDHAEQGYHLGAVKVGGSTYEWQTAKTTFQGYQGPYPDNGDFDVGNNVEYPGGQAYTMDNNIFWNYIGEFWKNSQVNKWQQVNDDGLLIGIFGTTGIDAEALVSHSYTPKELAGNAFRGQVVKVGSDYYVYHNSEGTGGHGGTHRWKISGLNTISEQSISVTSVGSKPIPGTNLMSGLTFNTTLVDGTNGWNRFPADERDSNRYTNSADYWQIKTNYYSYSETDPDLRMDFGSANKSYYVTRSLPATNSSTPNWLLTGRVSMFNSFPTQVGVNTGAYMSVLDDQGKVIAKMFKGYDGNAAGDPTWMNANGKKLRESTNNGFYFYESYPHEFEITRSGSGVIIKYAGESTGVVSMIDSTANINKPTTLKFDYISHFQGYGTAFSVDRLRFIEQ